MTKQLNLIAILLLILLPRIGASAQEPYYLVITGIIKQDDSVVIDKSVVVSLLGGNSEDKAGVGEFSLNLYQRDNSLIFSRHFNPGKVSESSGARLFMEIIPYDSMTSKIVLQKGSAVLETIFVSKNAPTVRLRVPDGGETITGETVVRWTASDADGDALAFHVLYSHDNGRSWSPIAIAIDEKQFKWDTRQIHGSDTALIKVIATDGVNTGIDLSDAVFAVERKPPVAVVLAPDEGTDFFVTDQINLVGEGYDYEDGEVNEKKLTWSSNLDGPLGVGHRLSLRSLSPGSHTVTLEVMDTDGNVGSESIVIQVDSNPDKDRDRISDAEDNCVGQYNPAQLDTDSDGFGDSCDDSDRDGYVDAVDNCRLVPNNQKDWDSDSIGDACDRDVDGDGVCDTDLDDNGSGLCTGIDRCANTVIPESVPIQKMKLNHWALTDNDNEFETVDTGKDKKHIRSYNTRDTAGCSCEQIIRAQRLDKRFGYYGCSVDVMDGWLKIVNP